MTDKGDGMKVSLTVDKTKIPAPKTYLRRNKFANPNYAGYINWETRNWGDSYEVKSFADAEKWIETWNKIKGAAMWEYKLPLHCKHCFTECNETYTGERCAVCYGKMMKAKKPSTGNVDFVTGTMKSTKLGMVVAEAYGSGTDTVLPAPKPTLVRKEGDIWPLSKASSPFGARQWAYQGSAKTPYVITEYSTKRDGAVTEEGWACSCPNFTKHTPRTDCKHILNVKLKEGNYPVKTVTAKLANIDEKKLAEFQKWEREKAAAKPKKEGEASLALFGKKGRKFR
jgi:predicted nucleic acid-binding Zn finger protein